MQHTKIKGLLAAAGCAIAMAGAAAPAQADVHWLVTGTFEDGGKLEGFMDINVYGYLQDFDLGVSGGDTTNFAAFHYTPETSYFSNGTFYVDAEPGYFNALHLTFTSDLGVAVAHNALLTGHSESWECRESWSCYVPQGDNIRYFTGGEASAAGLGGGVPEPATWGLMIAGFGLAGAALRRRRSATA